MHGHGFNQLHCVTGMAGRQPVMVPTGLAWAMATRLSVPCQRLVDLTGKKVFKPLINRSGLNCRILQGGPIRPGDVVEPA